MRTSSHHQPEAQHPKSPAIYTPAGRLPHLCADFVAKVGGPLQVRNFRIQRARRLNQCCASECENSFCNNICQKRLQHPTKYSNRCFLEPQKQLVGLTACARLMTMVPKEASSRDWTLNRTSLPGRRRYHLRRCPRPTRRRIAQES